MPDPADPGLEFVELRTLHDPMAARLMVEILEEHEIPVSSVGLEHHSLYGIAGGFVRIVLQVPVDRWEKADELVEAFLEAPPVAPEDYRHPASLPPEPLGPDEPQDDADESPLAPDRRALGALFYTFILGVFFGGGHAYARAVGPFLYLASTTLALFGAAMAGYAIVLLSLPFILLLDVLGSLGRIREMREGRRTGLRATLARRAFLIAPLPGAILLVLAMVAPASLARPFSLPVCQALAACAGPGEQLDGVHSLTTDVDACLEAEGEVFVRHPAILEDEAAWRECVRDSPCSELWACETFRAEGPFEPLGTPHRLPSVTGRMHR